MSPKRDTYEICLKGHLDERWVPWFEGFAIAHSFQNGAPVTRLYGPVADQAALHGVLIKLRDIGIPILSINLVEPEKGGRDEEEAGSVMSERTPGLHGDAKRLRAGKPPLRRRVE